MRLRHELLQFETEGGLDIVDLLLEQVHHFDGDEARAIAALPEPPPDALAARLPAGLLLEGPLADELRRAGWAARIRKAPPAPPRQETSGDWHLATRLPAFISAPWRQPERWRRLAEDRAAGRVLLRLEGLLEPESALALREAVSDLAYDRRENAYVKGHGYDVEPEELPEILPELLRGPLYSLLCQVLDEALPTRIFGRAWRLEEGDSIALHNDGVHYRATLSIGLCPDWSAADGGAIAFGSPTADGLNVSERWIPHLGDVLLFRPTATAWHAVEEVRRGTRYTLTSHFVAPEYPE